MNKLLNEIQVLIFFCLKNTLISQLWQEMSLFILLSSQFMYVHGIGVV